jgi:hypothetical protein
LGGGAELRDARAAQTGRAGGIRVAGWGEAAEDGAVLRDVEPEEGRAEEDDVPQGAERADRQCLGLALGCGVEGGRRAGNLGAQRWSGGAGAR